MPATAEYLAEHPFAPPDIVNPPEAPTYRYRPDINSLVDLAGIETIALSAGSRVDILIDNLLQTYVLQAGEPTGSDLEVVPDDYDVLLNQQYWLLVAASTLEFIGVGSLTFADIGGTISVDQLPPGSLATVDSIGEDALYFYDDETALPSLISADGLVDFLNGHISFLDIGGTISIEQFPPGSVSSIDSIDEDGFYFFDNDLFVPELLSMSDSRTALGLVIGTNVQAWDADLDTWATKTPYAGTVVVTTGKTFTVSNTLTLSATDGSTLAIGGGGTLGTAAYTSSGAYQPLDSDLTTIAGLTATTDNFIVSVSSAWASRTPAQVRTTLALVIGTNVQAWDADLDALAALSGTSTIYYRSAANTWTAVIIGSGLDFTTGTLSATGGSGNVAADAIWDAKGDLAAGTGADTAAKLTVGANDTMLMADSGQTTGLKWATPAQVRTALSLVIGTNVQAWDADLDTIAGLTATTDNFIVSVASAWASRTPSQVRTTLGLVIGTNVQAWDADLDTLAGLTATTDNFIVSVSSAWASRTPAQVLATLAAVGTTFQPLDGDLTTIAGLTATTDNFIVSVASAWASRTPAQVRTTLGLVIGTNVQAWDADLDTLAGLTATTDNFIVSVSSAWASRTPAQVLSTLAAVGTTFQPLDSDLTTIAGLTATTDNFIVSVSSAWASRTPTQVKTTLGLVIGTNVQAWDADLDTIAGLTATTDNFVVSVSSAWASRTPSQVRTTLALVIGTNVQAWDADLDTWAGVTPAANMATFIATPSSANLRATMTDEIGTGACVFDGATLSLLLTTATCGAALASLNIPAGTVPTTPNDGDLYADANCFYGCTDTGNPGYIPIVQVIRADSTVTQANDSNAHAIFTTPANGRITLETGTYIVRGLLSWSSMSATSGNIKIDLLGAGTATIGGWLWQTLGADSAAATNTAAGAQFNTTSATVASALTPQTAAAISVTVYGTFEVTGAGTLIPTQTLVTAAAAVLAIGSFLEFYRIGSTSLTTVGQWD